MKPVCVLAGHRDGIVYIDAMVRDKIILDIILSIANAVCIRLFMSIYLALFTRIL